MPNSGTSRPSSSTSGATRKLLILFTTVKTPYVVPNASNRAECGAHQLAGKLSRVAVKQSCDSLAGVFALL